MNPSVETVTLRRWWQLGTTAMAAAARWVCFVAVQKRHQAKAQQDGWHLLLAHWPLIGNNKHSLNTISLWLTDSNQPPTASECKRRAHTHARLVQTNGGECTWHAISWGMAVEMRSVYRRGKKMFGLLKIIVRRDVTARLECQELILTQQTENCYYSNQGIS